MNHLGAVLKKQVSTTGEMENNMGAWEKLRGQMAVATDRDFERLVLPLLRLFWPSMVQPTKLKKYDRAGIDLVTPDTGSRLSCAVQCKGFYSDRELTADHYRQIRDSINSFRESGITCDQFVLIHNRTGSNQKIVGQIDDELNSLVLQGSAGNTRHWNRQSLVADARKRLDELIGHRLRAESKRLLEQIERVFEFGSVHVPQVPVSEHRLILEKWSTPKIEKIKQVRAEIAHLVIPSDKTRWTLLTGAFGTGKSTTALHAALQGGRVVILARCADMQFPMSDTVGTNLLLRGVLQSLHLFDDFEDDDRILLETLAGPTLRSALSRPKTNAVLVLDGLDENRIFSTTLGMTTLANTLAELRCAIVLTTRQEHFDATIGNFGEVLDELTRKAAPSRDAHLFRLESWGDREVKLFLDQAANRSSDERRDRLKLLRSKIDGKEQLSWPRELLHHPLFLQMIAQLVAEGQDGTHSAAETIGKWTRRKIARDLAVPRLTQVDIIDRSSFVEKIMLLMERTAALMLIHREASYELVETIDSEKVVGVFADIFGKTGVDITAIAGFSLLFPVTQRRLVSVPVKFSHRAIQEYFTARHVRGTGIASSELPKPVQHLLSEMSD